MKKQFWKVAFIFLMACAGGKGEKSADLDGTWTAMWETNPVEGFTANTMNGQFIFNGDKLNIKAFGFEGCVFYPDTLDHVLNWKISGDSLILINKSEDGGEDTPGMIFTVLSQSDNSIKLKLLEDIFLTLNR